MLLIEKIKNINFYSGYSGCTSNPCQNDATCNDEEDGYNCTCVNPYTGTHCESKIFAFNDWTSCRYHS